MRAFLTLITALALASCGGGSDVEVGPGGELLSGSERATSLEARGVDLAGRTLVLDGFAGTIRVIGVDAGAPARLNFERVARGRTPVAAQSRLEGITLEESGDAETYTYRTRAPRPEGLEVNVEAQVPRDAGLVIRLDAGAVHLDNLSGDIEATLASGPVRAAGVGGRRVILQTESGALEAGAAALPAGAEWRLQTRAGAITLALPPRASTAVDAETRTGTIRVGGLDFADRSLERSGVGMRFRGRLGEGDGRIELRTDVGAIRLNAARPTAAPAPAAAPAVPAR
jgi:hypothetical protein